MAVGNELETWARGLFQGSVGPAEERSMLPRVNAKCFCAGPTRNLALQTPRVLPTAAKSSFPSLSLGHSPTWVSSTYVVLTEHRCGLLHPFLRISGNTFIVPSVCCRKYG